MSCEPGMNLGQYRIIERLGRGGMATVYKAFQPGLERYVAIKVLPAFYAEEPSYLQRFRQEARAVARLRHPNILDVFDFGEQGGVTYLVSEFASGGTLADRLGSPLSLERALSILASVASALDYAHSHQVIHRDVKPSNILLTDEGVPVVSDFGVAKMVGGSPLTESGTSVGTPEYMAPEQALGQAGPASDIYALGVVLYQMVTGRVPFSAETPMAVVLAHLHNPLPLPRTIVPELPAAVEGVILKALAKRPEDRYGSAGEMAKALELALSVPVATDPLRASTATPSGSGHVKQQPVDQGGELAPPMPVGPMSDSGERSWRAGASRARGTTFGSRAVRAVLRRGLPLGAMVVGVGALVAAVVLLQTGNRPVAGPASPLVTSSSTDEESRPIAVAPAGAAATAPTPSWPIAMAPAPSGSPAAIPTQIRSLPTGAGPGIPQPPVLISEQAGVADAKVISPANAGLLRAVRVLRGGAGPINRIAFSSDGKTLAGGGGLDSWAPGRVADAAVRLWKLDSPNEPRVFHTGFAKPIWGIALSPDGLLLAASGDEGIVDIFNVAAGALVGTFRTGAMVRKLAYLPDSLGLVAGYESAAGTAIEIRDLYGVVVRRIMSSGAIFAPSPDAKTLAAPAGGRLRLWETASGKELRSLNVASPIRSLVFSPDGTMLLEGTPDSMARLREAQGGALILAFSGHSDEVAGVAFSPVDGLLLATASYDYTVKLWDARNPSAELVTLRDHSDKVESVVFSPDGKTLASSSWDGTVRLWQVPRP